MMPAAHTGAGPRFPHRALAIRAGRLRGPRSAAARARYAAIIGALARNGGGRLLLTPINERAVYAALEAIDAADVADALVDFCRRQRNRAWVESVATGDL